MARTESKVTQVHPDDEQSKIEFMEIFHWNLVSSQHVKTKSSHFEERGEKVYSVVETEHFVNLTFSRDIDGPNIERIKALEGEYNDISGNIPRIPVESGLGWPIAICVFLCMFYGIGIIVGIIWIPKIKSRNAQIRAELPGIIAQRERIRRRQSEIIEECRNMPRQSLSEAPPVQTNRPSSSANDAEFWDGMDKSNVEDLQEYLIRFPDGRFVALARAKLERLGASPLGTS